LYFAKIGGENGPNQLLCKTFQHVMRRKFMRFVKLLPLIAASALLFSMQAFAKDAGNTGKFELTQSAQIGSTQLQPGNYEAQWTGPNDAVKVSILQHGKTVATVQGQLKSLPKAADHDAVTLHTTSDNNRQIDEIDFSKHSEGLVFTGM
jgi:hypothetical protein